jgi:hypothetical protein
MGATRLPTGNWRCGRVVPRTGRRHSAGIRKHIHFGEWPVYCRLSSAIPFSARELANSAMTTLVKMDRYQSLSASITGR